MKEQFSKLLQRCVQRDASDVHLKVGSPPWLRIDGEMAPVDTEAYSAEMMDIILDIMLNEDQKQYFVKRGEVDVSYTEKGVGRFRVNIFRQRGYISIVMRRIKTTIQTFEQLHLPPAMVTFAEMQRGLVLLTGTTGSGKTTTLASIVDYINRRRKCHIVTIEDPIEYLHQDRKALISQREIAMDTRDFSSALKAMMRQDPDVILVGEMRDLETFQAAISAAETGHLVFTTLHTTNVVQTIDRIIDLFPSTHHDQIRSQLSLNLRGIMCMRLLPRADGIGRVPTCEVLVVNPAARMIIKENRILQLDTVIASGREAGMQSFNDSLHDLIKSGLITKEVGMDISDNPEDLNMLLQGIRLSSRRGGILK
ncbi:MAG TPA: PilT/PilU family type 4a pilus ATPase [Candidatus Hydrogenedentes bacterium]|jgi:twitching motility protein PilT|nr:MAG: Twitching mobility protein [Candidatus Hydrogenedentes bacterium ADurb.Bin170]HOD96400.1 PilT/PilU family type 4a pilus ATPase [Candidatus Hydrogenedentota bacterium]HOR49674.1 PilT/PilU family type 4a pilus ATPase [Candidatus Hydrogenedentota bacterium]HPK25809.1 PilT/PilU family type 4a pilus ATPase [Candidatus Hydrogenedentota bacterium]